MHRTRSRVLVCLIAILTVIGLAGPATATTWANDNGFVPYGETSLFQTPLPDAAPVSPDNAYFVSWEKAHEPFNYWKLRVTSKQYAMNFAQGVCTDPVFTLQSTAKTQPGQDFLKTVGFHAPRAVFENMVQNSDSPLVIQDRCGNSARPGGFTVMAANVLYDGTQVIKSGGDGVLTGGAFDWRYNGLDYRAPSSNAPDGASAVSRGRIPEAFFIRDELLRRAAVNGGTGVVHPGAVPGTLGHTLEVFFLETNTSAGVQEPMIGAEGGNVGCGGSAHPTICAEGQRVRIKAGIAPPVGCTGYPLVVWKTLQAYGGYIGDNSGSGSGIKAEAGTTLLTNPGLQYCMTLDQLQILTKGYNPPHT